MARKHSSVAPDWWDYTTLDSDLIEAAAKLTPAGILALSRPGFEVMFYESLEEFYLAEALEYAAAWRQSTDDNPTGVCGPIGPTEHLPLVSRIVNELGLKIHSAHFLGMDEWLVDGKKSPVRILFRSNTPIASSASTALVKNFGCRKPICTSRKRIRPHTVRVGTAEFVAW